MRRWWPRFRSSVLPSLMPRRWGLREGQIVQGSVQARGDAVLFELNGRFFDLPPALQRVAPGDLRWFRVVRQGDSFTLKPVAPALSNQAQALSAESPGGVSNSANPTVRSTGPADAMLAIRQAGLLARGAEGTSLSSLLAPGALESQLIDAGAPELASALALSRLRSDALSPGLLQQAVARSGLWGEAALAAGRAVPQFDLKVLLRQMGRLLSARGMGDADDIGDAVDEIERKQLDAVQQAADGRQVFAVTIPFADSPAVRLKFERHARDDAKGDGGYSIDIHLTPPQVGDIWMKTTVMGKRVDVNVWSRRPEVVRLASGEEGELGASLAEAGLSLRAFRVLEGEPPGVTGVASTTSELTTAKSLGLDLKA